MLKDGQRLFGTDGVRGVANEELTIDFAMDLARAAADDISGPVVIGRDTRRSGEMLSLAMQAGFHSVGVDTEDVGVIPTAAIAHLTDLADASLGVVVSASHNPASDNGIKFFGGDGGKLTDALEDRIEARLRQGPPWRTPRAGVGIRFPRTNGVDEYLTWLKSDIAYTLRGIDVAIDGANGAAFLAAPRLFDELGLNVRTVACEPDGLNINDGCGATHPEFLASQLDGEIGLVFDGDADRFVAIDEAGVPLNGDVIMAIIARHLHEQGKLKNDTVVVTVMTNLGFRRAMAELDIAVVETAVGDRYVLEAMREHKANLGGEQSGHVIFLDHISTGDGLLTALRLLEVVAATGRPLTELRQVMTDYPQVLRNVRVADRAGLDGAEAVWEAVRHTEEMLGGGGRVLIRPSGTEPLVRVMVEAATKTDAATIADDLAKVVRAALGE
ncbi:MAG: phosphoglucosamine mutase [Acidimicrobiia bacterium]|nr:phosphoglucosamine mutase [Acidimicrobiia bacterium]MBT8192144.1 phosphoglucosamine mutase [Acidimicrobiia bacterium]NNF86963.1 phosphoglucosamine mutase [Acidimicrobiia bacterium]NNJ47934.1 phosphoglucosamine mutase [Acidimicrobiia bacterium]NNL98869.1 phosphoglucosamine mutase [Acidimicrobiia bacterium]